MGVKNHYDEESVDHSVFWDFSSPNNINFLKMFFSNIMLPVNFLSCCLNHTFSSVVKKTYVERPDGKDFVRIIDVNYIVLESLL